MSTGAVGAGAAATGLLLWAGPDLDPRALAGSFDASIAWVAALLAWGCAVWLAMGTLLVVVAQAHGLLGRGSARIAAAVTPRAFRRAVEVALGATLVTGPLAAPAALAAPLPDPGPALAAVLATTRDAPAALPSLDRPAAPAPPTSPAPPASDAGAGRPSERVAAGDVGLVTAAPRGDATVAGDVVVVVQRGDTLWTIAARHLGRTPTAAEIAHAWPRWYAANRARIGDDPDVLHPGDRLHPPRDAR